MKYYNVAMYATVRETVSVAASDEDDAVETALAIVQAGQIACKGLDWEITEVEPRSALDVAE